MTTPEFVPGDKKYAADLAALCDIASRGRNAALWQKAVDEGQSKSVFEIGRQGMLIPGHDLSMEHASVALVEGAVVGAVFGMTRAKDYGETVDPEQYGPDMRNELELKAMTGGSWYLAVIGVYRELRGLGYGKALMKQAAKRARAEKNRKMTLIVAKSNASAVQLYLKSGFRVVEERSCPPVRDIDVPETWFLMRRVLTP
ncbi:acetyltransferase (GNAT) family protein [Roseibium hamelinense]|uniref:Acetyltransferase (GNAT) family protein n=1 Tax=Roseibium hamelinense TaxID=150831 RepID=A0A562TAP2_9HYPH|nr:N-acetyltransferase [Roseibium hamelinense]MTI45371.1 N-acetyltransferase [Roseibium hamelinense]TWI90258.1 acetyltransferase (GNAT) family protein [Roseibium hamelinense]